MLALGGDSTSVWTDRMTALSHAAAHPSHRTLPVLRPSAPAPADGVVAEEPTGDKVIEYRRDASGKVTAPDAGQAGGTWWDRQKKWAWESLVPENLATSVSKDYVPTRKWQLARDFLGSLAGTSAVAAVLTAVPPASMALAALGVASLTLGNLTWAKDRVGQVVGLFSTRVATVAEKNPRPWMMAADVANNLTTVLDASVVLLPPLMYFPVLTANTLLRAVSGAAGGAAGANVGPRQALKGNLGEVSIKNGNQGTIATFAGATVGAAMMSGLSGLIGLEAAMFATTAVGAVGGLYCTYKMLQNLDYNPLNERGLRRVLDHMEAHAGDVCGPDPSLVSQVRRLFESDALVVGDSALPVLEAPDFPELRKLYADRPYLLMVKGGKPHLMMKDDEGPDRLTSATLAGLPKDATFAERMAQVQAAVQGLHVERLAAQPEYADRVAKDGQDKADRWLLEESLRKTPADIQPFMLSLQEKGWSLDMIRFRGQEKPTILRDAKP